MAGIRNWPVVWSRWWNKERHNRGLGISTLRGRRDRTNGGYPNGNWSKRSQGESIYQTWWWALPNPIQQPFADRNICAWRRWSALSDLGWGFRDKNDWRRLNKRLIDTIDRMNSILGSSGQKKKVNWQPTEQDLFELTTQYFVICNLAVLGIISIHLRLILHLWKRTIK